MITQALVANGATVYITGRRSEVLQTTVDKYGEGGKIIPCVPSRPRPHWRIDADGHTTGSPRT
jgi:hypothetical protein